MPLTAVRFRLVAIRSAASSASPMISSALLMVIVLSVAETTPVRITSPLPVVVRLTSPEPSAVTLVPTVRLPPTFSRSMVPSVVDTVVKLTAPPPD